MPNKKTSQRKKAAKQKLRQKDIRSGPEKLDLGEMACNLRMECDKCGRGQKTRSYCYFCGSVPRLPVCGQCGRSKCLGGDCLVRHPAGHATGLALVGAICDFCEAFLCHARRCLAAHACVCPLREAVCVECQRGVHHHGGRVFRCSFCQEYLCEDDQFQHQASCQVLESDSWKCQSCNRLGQYSCLRCKTCYCEEHVRRKGIRYERNQLPPCPKCGFETASTKDLSMSIRTHRFGQQAASYESSEEDYDYQEEIDKISDEEEEIESNLVN